MTSSSDQQGQPTLTRSMGVRELSAGIVTITIGGGIFVLPGIVAQSLGAAAWLAYVVCAVVFGLIALCFAEAGSRVQRSGGPYAYVEEAFGPFVGYICGVLVLLMGTIATAAVAAGFTGVLNSMIPGAGEGTVRALVLMGIFGFLMSMNLRGVSQGARVVEVTTFLKLIPLIFVGTVGLFAVKSANLAWPGMPPTGELARTSMMLMFAFFGLEAALVPSGEVRDPARTVPRAIFIAIGGITLLYLGVQQSAQGILGPALVGHATPLSAAAGIGFGHWAELMLVAGAGVSMLGNISGMMLSMPRSFFALARDGFLPSLFARVNPATRVPTNAILLFSFTVTFLSVTGSFASLLVLANVAALLLYLLCCLGVLGLRQRGVRLEAAPFVVRGGSIVPLLASAAIIGLLSTVKIEEYRAIAIALAVAAVLYLFRRRVAPATNETTDHLVTS